MNDKSLSLIISSSTSKLPSLALKQRTLSGLTISILAKLPKVL